MPVTFGNGEQRTFVVRALFDHPDWTGQAWIDRAAYAAVDPSALDTSVYVVGDDGAATADLRRSVDAVTAAYGNVSR